MSKKSKNQKSRVSYSTIADQTRTIPVPSPVSAWNSVDDIRKAYAVPASFGASKDVRLAQDSTFGGYDILYESLVQHAADHGQYPMGGFLGYAVLEQIAQNGMIRTCVQTVADDQTREWIEIIGGEDEDKDHVDDLQDLQEHKYKIRRLFNRALAMTGFYGGAFIFIDTGVEDPSIPLIISDKSAELVKDRPLRFVLVDPINVTPGDYNSTNPLRPDYMVPRWWWVQGQQVDSSRLIAVVDNAPPTLMKPAYNFLGIPQAQILWDYVLHWNRARVSTVGLLEKLNMLVFQTDMSEAINAGGISALDAKMMALNRYRNNDSIFVCDKEAEDIKNVTLSISGATDITRQALEHIAAINRTPAVKLLGISPSGFNATGESDIRNYYDHIRSKQELQRENIQTILDCIQLVEFGAIDSSISFEFKELGSDDELQTINAEKTQIDALSGLLGQNIINAEEARSVVKQKGLAGLDFIEDELPEPVEGEMADPMTTPPPDQMTEGGQNLLQMFRDRQSQEQSAPQPNETEANIEET